MCFSVLNPSCSMPSETICQQNHSVGLLAFYICWNNAIYMLELKLPATAGLFAFLYFHLITSKFLCNNSYVSKRVNLAYSPLVIVSFCPGDNLMFAAWLDPSPLCEWRMWLARLVAIWRRWGQTLWGTPSQTKHRTCSRDMVARWEDCK